MATYLYQNGVELALVSRILGHAYLDTTRIYAKPSLAMMREAMSSFPVSQAEDENHYGLGLKRKWPSRAVLGKSIIPRIQAEVSLTTRVLNGS